jgi:hypothetical protein
MELDCLEILEALAVELPDCTLDGVNARGFYQSVVGLCASKLLSPEQDLNEQHH